MSVLQNRGVKPYSFELESEYPEVFGSFKLPVAVVRVLVDNKFCCNAGISTYGTLDLMLPAETYQNLRAGKARMLFPVFVDSESAVGQLEAIEIVSIF